MDSGRIRALDLLRGVAMATVVAHHVSWHMLVPSHLAHPGGRLLAAVYLATDFGVPLFVAVSAFALVRQYGRSFSGLGEYLSLLGRRARRLLPAYVLWSLVSLAARDPVLLASPSGVADALWFGTADVQLYYVPMLFELYLLWPLLRPLLVRRSGAGALAVLAGGVAVSELARRGIVAPVWTPLLFLSTAVATGAGLRFLAPALSRQPERRSARCSAGLGAGLAVVAGLALYVGVVSFLETAGPAASRPDLYLSAMGVARQEALYAVCVTALLALAAPALAASRLGAMLASLGRASYGVFLVHLLVASTFLYRPLAASTLGAQGLSVAAAGLIAIWLGTLVLSYGATRLLLARPRLAWTVGGASTRPGGHPKTPSTPTTPTKVDAAMAHRSGINGK